MSELMGTGTDSIRVPLKNPELVKRGGQAKTGGLKDGTGRGRRRYGMGQGVG